MTEDEPKPLQEITFQLKETYPHRQDITDKIQKATQEILDDTRVRNMTPLLEKLQYCNNTLYNEEEMSDAILELQLWINNMRNRYDISDPSETWHKREDGDYLQ